MQERRSHASSGRSGLLLPLLLLLTTAPTLPAQTVRERVASMGEEIPALRQEIVGLRAAASRAALASARARTDSLQRQIAAVRSTFRAADHAQGLEISARMEESAARLRALLDLFAQAGDRAALDRILEPTASPRDERTRARAAAQQPSPLLGLAMDWRLLNECCALDLAAPPPPRAPRMPDVEGLLVAEARRVLDRAGIEVGRVEDEPSDARAGSVVRQRPPPGTVVRQGDSAGLWIAAPERPRMPGVIGEALAAARAILRRAGLRAVEVDSVESAASPGVVVAQDPAPGTLLDPGGPVRLTVSRAPLVPVPDLSRMTLDEAAAALVARRLVLGQTGTAPSAAPAGTVTGQAPPAGRRVRAGTAVSVTLAAVRLVAVPSVTSVPVDSAAAVLPRNELRVGRVEPEVGPGEPGAILRQRPAAGELVPPETAVDLVVSRAPPPAVAVDSVLVPELDGLGLDEARARLAGVGLGGAIPPGPGDGALWLVAAQSPVAGARVPVGSVVRLTLAPPARRDGGGPGWRWLAAAAAVVVVGAGAWRWRAGRTPPPRPVSAPPSHGPLPPPAGFQATLRMPPRSARLDVPAGRPLRRHALEVGLRGGTARVRIEGGVPFSHGAEVRRD